MMFVYFISVALIIGLVGLLIILGIEITDYLRYATMGQIVADLFRLVAIVFACICLGSAVDYWIRIGNQSAQEQTQE